MIKQSVGDSIPGGGLKNKVLSYIEHVSGNKNILKFLLQGMFFVLFKQFPTILGTYMRPVVYRSILGKVGSGCLIERDVRLEIPTRIFLNDRVFIGENCWISSGSIDGEIVFGNNTFIAHRCTLRGHGGKIFIGEHVHISRNSYINGAGDVEIGKDTLFGPNVVIASGGHNFEDLNLPIRLQGDEKAKIRIENDVWLGANVCVMPGVFIGKGAVVGAGAVVTKDLPPYSVAAGVPAKIIRNRKENGNVEKDEKASYNPEEPLVY